MEANPAKSINSVRKTGGKALKLLRKTERGGTLERRLQEQSSKRKYQYTSGYGNLGL